MIRNLKYLDDLWSRLGINSDNVSHCISNWMDQKLSQYAVDNTITNYRSTLKLRSRLIFKNKKHNGES